MGAELFSTSECAWAQTSVRVLGRTLVGIRGFSFKFGIEKEHIYAAGAKPIDIQSGNEKSEGSLTLLKFELDQMNDAAQLAGYDTIAHVPHTAISITCAYKKYPTDPIRTIQAAGVGFTEIEVSMKQNDKMTEINLPFLAISVKHVNG